MDHSEVKITGILLAGGMSSRMGREKGRIKLGNRYLYEYPLQILETCCDEILISTCLKHSSNELNVVLSYDMPAVSLPPSFLRSPPVQKRNECREVAS